MLSLISLAMAMNPPTPLKGDPVKTRPQVAKAKAATAMATALPLPPPERLRQLSTAYLGTFLSKCPAHF